MLPLDRLDVGPQMLHGPHPLPHVRPALEEGPGGSSPETLERLALGDAQRELLGEGVIRDARELPQRLVQVLAGDSK